MSITIQIQNAVNTDFVSNFNSSLKARNRWNGLTHFFDITSHLLTGTSIILAFVSGGTHISDLALVAGALGTCSQICFQYSLYCFKNYQLQSDLIEKMSTKEHVEDDLVNENAPDQTTPANTPATTNN